MSNVCGRCGRKLSSLRSRKLGFGEECWRRMRAVARVARDEYARGLIGAFTDRQIDSAEEAIELGAAVHIGDYSFEIVSTDGSTLYTSTVFTCTCPAGERNENCYHQVAAIILQGA